MCVNSAFTGFFTSRLLVWFSITMMMLVIFFTTSSFTAHSDRDLRAKQGEPHDPSNWSSVAAAGR